MAYVSPTNIEDLAKKLFALTFSEMMIVCNDMNSEISMAIECADSGEVKPFLRMNPADLASIFSDWSKAVVESYETRAKGE